jgi:hypothetical protein
MPDRDYIFKGITGSVAYGLDTEDSDVDRKGIFVFRTEEIFGLKTPDETVTSSSPDFQGHEIGKFFRLALGCNPNLIELMFLPQNCVELEDSVFTFIRANRTKFLSEGAVRAAYGGYARQQLSRIERRMSVDGETASETDKRVKKHARHCFRLFDQGAQLLRDGVMDVRVTKEKREELFALGDVPFPRLSEMFLEKDAEFKAIPSNLPDSPDSEWVNELLVEIRKMRV